MDNNKLLAALEESEERLADALRDKGTDIKDIGLILETLAHVRGLADTIAKRGDPYHGIVYDIRTNSVLDDPEPTTTKEPEPEPTVEPAPAPVAEPEPEIKPCPKPEPRLTKQDMVTQLTAFANDGVDVAAVMLGMGCAKLSEVPESRYGELLEAVKKAKREAD